MRRTVGRGRAIVFWIATAERGWKAVQSGRERERERMRRVAIHPLIIYIYIYT